MIKVAVSQFKSLSNQKKNIDKVEYLIKEASREDAQLLLLQELFMSDYFCSTQNPDFFNLSITLEDKVFLDFSKLCKDYKITIPFSFFEKNNTNYFNSLVIINSDGSISDIYRKSHIPDGPGYNEKFYFSPGDTGFKVFETCFGKLGCGICWDQWFPEAARIMTMMGADLLLYPTAIGSEPHDSTISSLEHWKNVMKGHAAANQIPVLASNRIGVENLSNVELTFYGNSFICNHLGSIEKEFDHLQEGILISSIDLSISKEYRRNWGNFRDRRPDLYSKICQF